jgi:hypothetical protein
MYQSMPSRIQAPNSGNWDSSTRPARCAEHSSSVSSSHCLHVLNEAEIAFSIPNFEGQAILRIFSNTTESEIACYTAAITNGATFNQQQSVGTILGIFALMALLSSIATSIYGQRISDTRTHYAHSLSVMVVFAVFHHIYFTGALSMNWPSVLVAFWANYAWSAGMIYNSGMQTSISMFTGRVGDTLSVGAASTGANSSSVGGGYNIHTIYKRGFATPKLLERSSRPDGWFSSVDVLSRRDLPNTASGYKWYGPQIASGLPLPGNFSGFTGTLSEESIPASNAFLTGFVWFVIGLSTMTLCIAVFKAVLELLARRNAIKTTNFDLFRSHWKRYIVFAILRGCFIAFFMIMYLAMFQFTYHGRSGVLAVTVLVFLVLLFGMFAVAVYAMYLRLHQGTWILESCKVYLERSTVLGFIPWYIPHYDPIAPEPDVKFAASLPFWKIQYSPPEDEIQVHEDEGYIMRFGWLSARYRASRWWFFCAWLFYEFARACFLAGASGHPLVQVFCLLVIEFAAFIVIVRLRPFESQRLNIVMAYLLGLSKVLTVALSAAFDITFNINRITATVIGIIIIVIQLLLTIALMVCIILSAISSYFSITRDRETIWPRKWLPRREKFFKHINQAATGGEVEIQPSPELEEEPKKPTGPYFSVKSVKRVRKIEDEDGEFQKGIVTDPRSPFDEEISDWSSLAPEDLPSPVIFADSRRVNHRLSSAQSLRSQMSQSSLPFAAALYRGYWTPRDFAEYQAERNPSLDRIRAGGHDSPRPSERAMSPKLRHLSSRDTLETWSRPASMRDLLPSKERPLCRNLMSAPLEREWSSGILTTSSDESPNQSESPSNRYLVNAANTRLLPDVKEPSPPTTPAGSKRLFKIYKRASSMMEDEGIEEEETWGERK